eukprot:XP_011666492.1 PREDICTED: S-crystallin SL11 isoform X2 [Strongylocentrotus purpuratus]
MSTYELVYFNFRGGGEISRLLFAQAGVEFKDTRLTQDEFKAVKGDVTRAPLGQLPVLIVKGTATPFPPIPQSHAIERYLARKFDMYGKNIEEATRIDVACECVVEIFTHIVKMFFEKDDAKKKELGKSFVEKDSKTVLTAMCNALKKNSGGKGFFVGDKMTLADIAVFHMTEAIFGSMPPLAAMYPALKDFSDRMRAEPKIAAWIKKRPVTQF